MRGRVCVVTGANRGLGRATAAGLARLGATVVMLCRDGERCARARDELGRDDIGRDDIGRDDIGRDEIGPDASARTDRSGRTAAGGPALATVVCDLASPASIRAAADEIGRRFPAVHVLVNNAGVNLARRTVNAAGVELTLAVNHLGPFLLTHLLLPLLRAGAPSRIVNVTSRFERLGRIRFDDLQGARRYRALRAYTQSKLANVLFTYALAERLRGTGVTVNCVHPGLVATDLMRDWPRWMRKTWEWLLLTPEEGARGVIRLASDPALEGVTGRYFEGERERRSSPRSRDVATGERLWRVSAALAGVPGDGDDRAQDGAGAARNLKRPDRPGSFPG